MGYSTYNTQAHVIDRMYGLKLIVCTQVMLNFNLKYDAE